MREDWQTNAADNHYDDEDGLPVSEPVEEGVVYVPPVGAEDTEEEAPVWTTRRLIYLIVVLIIIAALTVYFLLPLLQQIGQVGPPPEAPPSVQI